MKVCHLQDQTDGGSYLTAYVIFIVFSLSLSLSLFRSVPLSLSLSFPLSLSVQVFKVSAVGEHFKRSGMPSMQVRFKKWSRGKETDHEGPLGYNWTWAASSLLRFAFLLTTRCFAFVEVSSLEVWLSHVPPNVRLQIWFSTVDLLHLQGMAQWFRFSSRLSKESCDDSSFRTWVTVWHLKEPLMRMMITSRSRQDSRENMRKPLVAHVELSAFLSDAAFQESPVCQVESRMLQEARCSEARLGKSLRKTSQHTVSPCFAAPGSRRKRGENFAVRLMRPLASSRI